MLITDLNASMNYRDLCDEVRVMCSLPQQLPLTLKWIDDEGGEGLQCRIEISKAQSAQPGAGAVGSEKSFRATQERDPCTISSQMELEEAFRLYSRNRNSGLLLHGESLSPFPVFPKKSFLAFLRGLACPVREKTIILINMNSGMSYTCEHAEYDINGQCCPMCAPGTHVHKHCTDSTSTSCKPCFGKTFLDEPNGLVKCRPCTVCDPGLGLIPEKECNFNSDTVWSVGSTLLH
ncbi:hypothetical protein JZ751_008525 [Albula glossodonta]|uniref:TNFR-Cys domain-containing protein n=1 Tax=Albula glossodonta TaxID=121402 RepID=A0A8T2MKR5_9TELE|nr:hypothetical protein JZ751_008525 [Albula glossodonta]